MSSGSVLAAEPLTKESRRMQKKGAGFCDLLDSCHVDTIYIHPAGLDTPHYSESATTNR